MKVASRSWVAKRSKTVAMALLLGAVGWTQAGWTRSGQADVLKVAPANSLVVIKVKNLQETSKKFGALATQLGLTVDYPQSADPLGTVLNESGIKEGVLATGELGIILLPADKWPTDPEESKSKPATVILVPVSDYKAFLGNFKESKLDGDVTEARVGTETIFVSSWGEYAAIAPDKAYLAKGEGLTVNASAAKEFDTRDIVAWANVPAMKAAFGPKLAEHRAEMLGNVEEELKNNPQTAKFAPVAKAAVSQLLNAAETFLGDSVGSTISLNVTDVGVNYALATEFKPESYLGKTVSALRGTPTASFTTGLPEGAYLFYGGSAAKGETVAKVVTDLAGPIIDELAKVEGQQADQIRQSIDSMKKMMSSVSYSSFGMIAPRGQLNVDSVVQVTYFIKGDSKAFQQTMKEYGEGYAKVLGAMDAATMPLKVEYKPANKVVDGVSFDSLVIGPPAEIKTPEAAQMANMLRMMYGKAGPSQHFAAIDDSTSVMVLGLADATISKVIAAAKAGADPLGASKAVMATAKQLPPDSVGVFYFAPDELIRTGAIYARNMGLNVNVALPDGLPPIGTAVAADGSVLRVDTHVPTELVQAIVVLFLQMKDGGMGM